MRLAGVWRAVFAVALAGLGVLSLGSGDFAYPWQPVPPWATGVMVRSPFAYASGALLLAGGGGLLWPRTLRRASLVLILYGTASMLLVHAPRLTLEPSKEVEWFNCIRSANTVDLPEPGVRYP